jgi:L-glutamine-phosphate cytidylyltransferase
MTGGDVKGIILAAGRGARLQNGDSALPKCLVSLGGETMLGRNARTLRECGVPDVVVVVGCQADAVRRSCPGVTFVENRRYAQTNSLYSLWLARAFLTGGFVVMNCDVLVHPQLVADLLSARHEDALLLAYRDEQTLFGEEEMKVRVRCGRVVDISKTMAAQDADGENLGIVKFGVDGARILLEEMDRLVGAGEDRAWVPRAFKAFAARRPLHVVGTRGYPWIEIDFPQDYRRARDYVLPEIEKDHTPSTGTSFLTSRIARSA